jgi:hypothetical protein
MGTKALLVALIAVGLVVVMGAWYATTSHSRRRYTELTTLREISFQPRASGAPGDPVLTFTFDEPVGAEATRGVAALKSFTPDQGEKAEGGDALVAALLHRGGAPFVPESPAPATLATNTLPATLRGDVAPIRLAGRGTVRITPR